MPDNESWRATLRVSVQLDEVKGFDEVSNERCRKMQGQDRVHEVLQDKHDKVRLGKLRKE